MCAAASVLSIASVNCSSVMAAGVMAAGVMAAGCRYLDDDLVPLREQGICRPFDRQLGANRRFSAGEYWFGGLKTQQTLRPANKPG